MKKFGSIKIAAITSARSDFGIMRPVYEALLQDRRFDFSLIATGAHFFKSSGHSIQEIRHAKIPIRYSLPVKNQGTSPEFIACSAAEYLKTFAKFFARHRFDLILVLGDRYEYGAILLAGLIHNQPFGHVSGGELTLGSTDDGIRHCLTKLSHLHFVANRHFATRVAQLGEEAWRIHVTGSPTIDTIQAFKSLQRRDFFEKVGLRPGPFALVTLHPETVNFSKTRKKIDVFFSALEKMDAGHEIQWLITFPGDDVFSDYIILKIKQFARSKSNVSVRPHLGHQLYFSALQYASVMLGNSSSGLVEAPSFGLPVLNVGQRQEGRPRSRNVQTIAYNLPMLVGAFGKALRLKRVQVFSPYGNGNAVSRMIAVLRKLPSRERLLHKQFRDVKISL